MTVHPIPPVWDESSRILILGSFPSVRSREEGFFYAHRQNRFWRLLAALFGEKEPESIEEKKRLLIKNRVALWDVIRACEVTGSADSAIKNAEPNDISGILAAADIKRIYANGGKAWELYMKHIFPQTGVPAVKLPSTSPANARCSFERLRESWKRITDAE
ncbi:MAG: DNA-deoxyinosine glycosylase [Oscillospiraceae bacterium]|nr:DNA-deoxyinosine glycosylase [Oscillospiraceae bacterium]